MTDVTDGRIAGFLARHEARFRALCRAGFAAGVLAVVVVSLLPRDELPDLDLSDKVEHFIAYCGLAALGVLAFPAAPAPMIVLFGMAALGGALEAAQAFVPGRSADPLDFVANCLGALAGYGLIRLAAAVWPSPVQAPR